MRVSKHLELKEFSSIILKQTTKYGPFLAHEHPQYYDREAFYCPQQKFLSHSGIRVGEHALFYSDKAGNSKSFCLTNFELFPPLGNN